MKKMLLMSSVIIGMFAIAKVYSKSYPNSQFTYAHFCHTNDKDFRELRYAQKIPVCNRNVSYTTRVKIYEKYQIPEVDRINYTIDHLIPLSLGGSNAEQNLWPQPKSQTTAPLESELFFKVRNNEITVQEAINALMKEKYPNE